MKYSTIKIYFKDSKEEPRTHKITSYENYAGVSFPKYLYFGTKIRYNVESCSVEVEWDKDNWDTAFYPSCFAEVDVYDENNDLVLTWMNNEYIKEV